MTAAAQKPRLTTSAMIASIAAEGQRVQAAPFGKALVELAAKRPEVVGLTADLAKYTDLHLFAQAYPERFFQMGMPTRSNRVTPSCCSMAATCRLRVGCVSPSWRDAADSEPVFAVARKARSRFQSS